MSQEKEYFAFISYQREDEKWAKWLAHELEHYHLPTTTLNGKDLPKNLRPIFRDVDELAAGNLPEQIYHALSISKNLIVVCSPRSVQSEWVNKEIEDFINIKKGKTDNIYPFIIEGIPFSKDTDKECFPEKLRKLPESEERLGGNINDQGGGNAAVVKIIAGMLGIGFDSLWQKYKRNKRKARILKLGITSLFLLLIVVLLLSTIKLYDNKVAEFCRTGIKADDGLFNTQKKLLEYQKYKWLLKKETQSLLKNRIYEIDYSYNISPLPIIYSYQTNGGIIDQVRFRLDESQILIGTSIAKTSGVLDYRRGKFKQFNHYAASVDYIHNSDTIITCGMGVYKYSNDAEQLVKFDIDGYGMILNPQQNHFTCINMNELATYKLADGSKMTSKNFGKDVSCYAYNKSGEYLAVATIDSLLSVLRAETGEMVWQRKYSSHIGAITAATDDRSFFVAFYGDSTRVSKIETDSLENETLMFTVPSHFYQFHKNVLSYTTGDYLAFTNGRYFVLHNIQTGESFPLDIKTAFNAEMDAIAMSPSGTKVCYTINGKVYVVEIKDKKRQQRFPIQHYGFSNVTGPTVAGVYPNDTTIIMAVIEKKDLTSVGLFNLYTGEAESKIFETTAPIWKVIPLPIANHAAVALDASNSWAIIDFANATPIKYFSTDTLTCLSNLMLSANHKYLIGTYTGPYNFKQNDSRCVWSAKTYDCIDSAYFNSGPLQDGEHMYNSRGIYTYPEGKESYKTTDFLFVEDEIFDGDEMAYVDMSSLILYDIKKRNKRLIDLKKYGQGKANNYKLMGFKSGFAILFNKEHLMIIDTKSEDLVLQKMTTPYECITSATFFNNQSRVLVTTNAALYIFDLLKYKRLIDIWNNRLNKQFTIMGQSGT